MFINEAVAKYASINKDKILSDNNITSQVEPDELMNLAKDHMERESRIDDI
ncbi:hypothetical protein HOF65_04440 [bacterium]|nr:hypothetical protein [bacterium]